MRVSYNTFARSCRANAYVCLRLSSTTFFKTFALSLSASTRRTAAFRHFFRVKAGLVLASCLGTAQGAEKVGR